MPGDEAARLGAANPPGCTENPDRTGERGLRPSDDRGGVVVDEESIVRREERAEGAASLAWSSSSPLWLLSLLFLLFVFSSIKSSLLFGVRDFCHLFLLSLMLLSCLWLLLSFLMILLSLL